MNGDTKSLPVSQLHKISKVKNSNSATQKVWKWEEALKETYFSNLLEIAKKSQLLIENTVS